mmetsp:Transcript_8403/g.14052  ORF Transcript_8403/g.14052 Transcript_8403/m.14052 type:complete len:117 (-) Transcript_8403:31-381(-)
MSIGLALRPRIDADDLQRIVREDFELDSMDKLVIKEEDKDDPTKVDQAKQNFEMMPQKAYDYLDNDKLYEALFVLADSWCPTTNELEYKEFFSILKFKLVYNNGMQDNQAYDVLVL